MTETAHINLASTFLRATREMLLDQSWTRLRTCVESLTDEQIWWRPNSSCNSIGNLLLHLNGNVTQWIITAFTQSRDHRDRPAEFSRTEGIPRDQLIQTLSSTMHRVSEVLAQLTEADLLAACDIQGYHTTGMEA
ncbi:MAG TPA: DinB family protein, partial [Terracidiphilus sp.]